MMGFQFQEEFLDVLNTVKTSSINIQKQQKSTCVLFTRGDKTIGEVELSSNST